MIDDFLTPDILFFFDGHPGALALFGALAERLLAEYPQTEIVVTAFMTAMCTPMRR